MPPSPPPPLVVCCCIRCIVLLKNTGEILYSRFPFCLTVCKPAAASFFWAWLHWRLSSFQPTRFERCVRYIRSPLPTCSVLPRCKNLKDRLLIREKTYSALRTFWQCKNNKFPPKVSKLNSHLSISWRIIISVLQCDFDRSIFCRLVFTGQVWQFTGWIGWLCTPVLLCSLLINSARVTVRLCL